MKKMLVVSLIFVLLISAFMFGCGSSDSGNGGDTAKGADNAVYEFSGGWLASTVSPVVQGPMWLAELLEKETGGRIIMTVYHSGALGSSDREMLEKAQQGITQMATVPTFTTAEVANMKEFFICDQPYLFQSYDEVHDLFDSEIGKELFAKLEDKIGMKVYGLFCQGMVQISTVDKPIHRVGDLKNLKIRATSSDMYMKTLQALGAAPTTMSFGEVYTALQQGAIDGNVSPANLHWNEKYYEVEDYIVDTNLFTLPHIVFVNKEWYAALPADLQPIFDNCMAQYVQHMRDVEYDYEDECFDKLESAGMTVHRLTDEERQGFIDAVWPLTETSGERVGQEFFDEVRAFLGR